MNPVHSAQKKKIDVVLLPPQTTRRLQNNEHWRHHKGPGCDLGGTFCLVPRGPCPHGGHFSLHRLPVHSSLRSDIREPGRRFRGRVVTQDRGVGWWLAPRWGASHHPTGACLFIQIHSSLLLIDSCTRTIKGVMWYVQVGPHQALSPCSSLRRGRCFVLFILSRYKAVCKCVNDGAVVLTNVRCLHGWRLHSNICYVTTFLWCNICNNVFHCFCHGPVANTSFINHHLLFRCIELCSYAQQI